MEKKMLRLGLIFLYCGQPFISGAADSVISYVEELSTGVKDGRQAAVGVYEVPFSACVSWQKLAPAEHWSVGLPVGFTSCTVSIHL